MVPLDVGNDAGHVHLALERCCLAGPGRHVVHYVLYVGFATRPDWKGVVFNIIDINRAGEVTFESNLVTLLYSYISLVTGSVTELLNTG